MNDKIDLPDLVELGEMIEKINELATLVAFLDIDIKLREAEINKEASLNPKYFQNNKPPSQAYIDNTWKFSGFDSELIPLRKRLAEAEIQLEGFKMKYRLLLNMIDIWRTQSANERLVSM